MIRNSRVTADITLEAHNILRDYCKEHERSKGFLLEKMIRAYCQPKETASKEKVNTSQQISIRPSRVAEIYNELFSGTYARQKQVLTDSLKATIRSRCKNDFKTEQSWVDLFEAIKSSDFLMGRVQVGDRKPFQLSLEWIVKPANLAKILEGTYHE